MTDAPDRSSRPFDRGLQPERTALAWRRTALALGVGTLLSGRVLSTALGPWTLAVAGAGLVAAIVVYVASERRYRTHHRVLTSAPHDRVPLSDGRLPALVSAVAVGGGILLLIAVLRLGSAD